MTPPAKTVPLSYARAARRPDVVAAIEAFHVSWRRMNDLETQHKQACDLARELAENKHPRARAALQHRERVGDEYDRAVDGHGATAETLARVLEGAIGGVS